MIEYSHFYNIGVMKNLSVVPLSLRIRIRAMWNCIENIKGIPIWIKFLSTSILYNPLELHLNGSTLPNTKTGFVSADSKIKF